MPETVFISYRQGDAAHARAVQTSLANRLRGESVFRDVTSIGAGDDLRAIIPSLLDRSTVVLALIGPAWADTGSGRPPLARTDDWVRFELSLAIAWHKRIVPVLVGGARMPERAVLPRDVRAVADIVAIQLRDTDWDADMSRLVGALAPGAAQPIERASQPRIADTGPVAGGDISITGDIVAGRDLDLGRDG